MPATTDSTIGGFECMVEFTAVDLSAARTNTLNRGRRDLMVLGSLVGDSETT
jgi:hypothetical protein